MMDIEVMELGLLEDRLEAGWLAALTQTSVEEIWPPIQPTDEILLLRVWTDLEWWCGNNVLVQTCSPTPDMPDIFWSPPSPKNFEIKIHKAEQKQFCRKSLYPFCMYKIHL